MGTFSCMQDNHQPEVEETSPEEPPFVVQEHLLPASVEKGVNFSLDSSGHVYLVGTAHVSEESAEEVKKTIELVQPHTVFVELCESRKALLLPKAALAPPKV